MGMTDLKIVSWLILSFVHTLATVCSLLLSSIDAELHFTVHSPLWLNICIYTYKNSTTTNRQSQHSSHSCWTSETATCRSLTWASSSAWICNNIL